MDTRTDTQNYRSRISSAGPSKGASAAPSSGLPVPVHQGDDENRDVVAGAQPLVGDPPPSVPQHAARAHDQVLRRHRIPAQGGKRRFLSQLWPLGGGRRPNYAPVKVVGVTVGQEGGDGFGYFLVGQNVPESVRPHDQDVVGSVLVVRQVVNFHLKQERELAARTHASATSS